MTGADRLEIARNLAAHGQDPGVHPQHGVVVYYANRIWRVVGGNCRSPSLMGLRGVRIHEVTWLKAGVRPEPVR